MTMLPKLIVITMGDPAGIGVELTLRLLKDHSLPPLYIIAPYPYVDKVNRDLNLNIKITPLIPKKSPHFSSHIPPVPPFPPVPQTAVPQTAAQPAPNIPTATQVSSDSYVPEIFVWDCFDPTRFPWINRCNDGSNHDPLQPSVAFADSVIHSLNTAVDHIKKGWASAMMTNPINKSIVNQHKDWNFPGQTEYLGEKFHSQPIMMMWTKSLKVIPLTTHIPIHSVSSILTKKFFMEQTQGICLALQNLQPRKKWKILFTGLNPHAGDEGYIGLEEQDIIIPSLQTLQDQWSTFKLIGPMAADTAFIPSIRKTVDVIVSMYHDQALGPMKALYFDKTVNVTLGIHAIRTSPDHGPAYNLVYSQKSSYESLYHAILLAQQLAC